MKPLRVYVGDFRLYEEEKQSIYEVLDSGHISEGKKVAEFEKKWAKFVGTKYCIATSSGAGALIAGLAAVKYLKGLKDGTKVITTPLTYIATSSAISAVGLEPVYVDVDRETFCITPENIRAVLDRTDDSDKYAIILLVHLMGYATDMDEVNRIAEEYGLITFEDSAQAHGTIYNGKKTGSLSLLAAFSFYIAHNIQAGEMGAITTDDPEINCLVRKLKAQGRSCDCLICTRSEGWCPRLNAYGKNDDFDPRFTHDLIGYNFKPMEFQAALALTQLAKADWIIRQRQQNVRYLNEHLAVYKDILQLPRYSNMVSYLAYPLVIKRPDLISRRELREDLAEEGIETRPLFGCIPIQQPAYSYLKGKYQGRLPNAEYLGLNGFYVGCHQYLSQDDLDYMVAAFDRILHRKAIFQSV